MNKIFIFLIWLTAISCFSQTSDNAIRSEFFIGKSIPSYEINTGQKPQLVFGMSYEHKNNDNSIEWQSILKNPTTGVSLYYANYGTKTKGSSISLIPFVAFHPLKNQKWTTKFGMGISYFDTKYHPINNVNNKAISSDFTWAIQGIVYYDATFNNIDLRLGLGAFHHSNGHTKLPNQGLNSALFSVSTAFDLKNKKQKKNNTVFDKLTVKKYSNKFYGVRFGNGIQTFLFENSKLKNIYSASINGGVFYKNVVKLSLGANYRFYEHYYDYIVENNTEPYIKKPKWNASSVYLSVGVEVMLGYVGIDWEGGLNVHKPFYKEHYKLQNFNNTTKYTLKKMFLGRLGMKLYVINTKKKPKNNIYLAAHINSNLSQADFSELSIGFTRNIFKNK